MPAITLTDLEATLAGPDGQATRRALAAQLADIETRLAQRIAAGLPRDAFADWQAATDAVRAAQEVLDAGATVAPAASPAPSFLR